MDRQTRYYLAAFLVLAAGVCAAVAIWLTAADEPLAWQFVAIEGRAVAIAPGESKQYVRQVQTFGGKAGVLFDEIERWFAGLWRGKSLAVTVGWIAVFLSVALFLLGWIQPAGAEPDDADEGDRPG